MHAFPSDDLAASRARAWLWLAACAVAASSLFALLIVFARVPAIGMLLPGTQFYRVALTLHVNLSQLIWFSAFAGMLWSLTAPVRGRMRGLEPAALALCGTGAAAMALTPALGAVTPLMSNYLPVLESRPFLAGALLFGGGLGLQALLGVRARHPAGSGDGAFRTGVALAAAGILLALAMLPWTATQIGALDGMAFFEFLFWGSGHVWESALVILMMSVWLGLVGKRAGLRPSAAKALVAIGAAPLVAGLFIQASEPVLSAAYRDGFTAAMRYASWEAPLLLGMLLYFGVRGAGRDSWRFGILRLALQLFVAGLLLGSVIDGQNTLITAHYHGTIGAMTVSFMGLTYALLPALGLAVPAAVQIRRQTACYAWGNLLMMAGLAGAGLMGAPRKAAGNISLDFSVETAARLLMGLGGTLAMIGIIGFFILTVRALRQVRRDPAPLGCAVGQ
jgi:hypothetical protein